MTKRRPEELEEIVLAILGASGDRPLSAYDIARKSKAAISPVQAYRTLNRLVHRQLARRIEVLNAYALMPPDTVGMTVCTNCHGVAPICSGTLSQFITRALAPQALLPTGPLWRFSVSAAAVILVRKPSGQLSVNGLAAQSSNPAIRSSGGTTRSA